LFQLPAEALGYFQSVQQCQCLPVREIRLRIRMSHVCALSLVIVIVCLSFSVFIIRFDVLSLISTYMHF
jgi:hypothetical protein